MFGTRMKIMREEQLFDPLTHYIIRGLEPLLTFQVYYLDHLYPTSELQASFVMWGTASWIRGSDLAIYNTMILLKNWFNTWSWKGWQTLIEVT